MLFRKPASLLAALTPQMAREIHVFPFVFVLILCLRPLQNYLHGLVVVSLDLEVRYPAVALRCGNLAMPQEILNGRKVSIGVEELRGHSVAKPMT